MNREADREAASRVPPTFGAALVLAGALCNQWLVAAFLTSDGELTNSATLTFLWGLQAALIVSGVLAIWLRPSWSLIWSMSKVSLLILWIVFLLEISTRTFNAVHALERPANLKHEVSYTWLEGGDWMNGETRLYTYTPNSQGTSYGHPVRVNSWGFRGPEVEMRRVEPDAAFRVMVLGDSTTMGHSVEENARYSDVLGAQLRKAYPKPPIEIVNLAIEGYETVQEEKILRRFWPAVTPDLVILGFSINDPSLHYRYQQPYPIPLPPPIARPLRRLLSYRLLEQMYDPLFRSVTNTPTPLDEMWQGYDPDSRDWKMFEQSVASIGSFVHDRLHRAPIAICLYEVNALHQKHVYDAVVKTFTKNGFVWVEIPPGRFRPVSRFEPHSNEETHAEFAKVLFSEITRSHVIEQGYAAR